VARLFSRAWLLGLLAALSACAAGAERPARPAPVEAETRLERRPRAPKILAPPPAYGNKIVMAEVEPEPTL